MEAKKAAPPAKKNKPVRTVPAAPPASERQTRGHRDHITSVDLLRLILMLGICINYIGFPTRYGQYVQIACGFIPPVYFILSGYLVLRDEEGREKRLLRAIRRSGIALIILSLVYFALHLVVHFSYIRSMSFSGSFLGTLQSPFFLGIFDIFRDPNFWFENLVLNIWNFNGTTPSFYSIITGFNIGSPIWYVQALFYSYVILYFLNRRKPFRWDKLIYIPCLCIATLFGELSSPVSLLLHRFFPSLPLAVMGRTYISGNFLTRALPFLLIGGALYRRKDRINSYSFIWKLLPFLFGLLLLFGEYVALWATGLLTYTGFFVGFIPMAVSVVMLVTSVGDISGIFLSEYITFSLRRYTNIIYYIFQPVYLFTMLLFFKIDPTDAVEVRDIMFAVTYVFSLLLAVLFVFAADKIRERRIYGKGGDPDSEHLQLKDLHLRERTQDGFYDFRDFWLWTAVRDFFYRISHGAIRDFFAGIADSFRDFWLWEALRHLHPIRRLRFLFGRGYDDRRDGRGRHGKR